METEAAGGVAVADGSAMAFAAAGAGATGSTSAAHGLAIEEREIGRVVGVEAGPTLVVVGGIHGNEPAGLHAARRVLDRLAQGDVVLDGELVVLAGNLGGLRDGTRYRTKDLNRLWSDATIAANRRKDEAARDDEDREQLALHGAIEAARLRARGRVHLADLHTSSAPGVPFVLFGDTLDQRRFVRAFPLPVIIGLEEQIDAALAEYWTRRGCVTFTVEGGQHDDPQSRDALEAVLWLALKQAGLLRRGAEREVLRARQLLDGRRGSLPRFLEVVSRHAITVDDAFVMEPGFRNLAPVRAGQPLARDRRGTVRASSDGVVILPLYQRLGSDGFFWGRALSERALRTQEVVRRVQLAAPVERLIAALPWVRPDAEHPVARPTRFLVDERIDHRVTRGLFRLLGYRRVRPHARGFTVEKQPE